jgi:hypothetical protein
MNTNQIVKADERTVAVLYASNTWGFNVILFALLIDIFCRSVFFHEQAWDLFAVIGVSGVIQTVYLARHKVLGQGFGWKLFGWNWKVAIVMAVVAVVAFVIAVIVAMTKAM